MTFAIVCLSLGVVGSVFNFFSEYGENMEKKGSSESTREGLKKVLSTFASETDHVH